MSKPPRITKAQAASFRKRWKLVNDRQAEELRTKKSQRTEGQSAIRDETK